ncbi:MAG TPA: serine/threonine-protein kinase [Trichocoleus sp.]|jgi:serine/threonine protein kinase
MIGQLLTGRYLILKKLGAGGFSETYLARDKYLPHHPLCVVKHLTLSSNTISLEVAKRLFETEARILDHLGQQFDQVPTLFAYCQEYDQIYLVQEYIDGENLENWITQKRRLTAEGAVNLLRQVLPILKYIHSHQIIHRDIKPSNLIRRHQDGKVVLIDFGAACKLSETENAEPKSDALLLTIGTPGYMPEEQHLGMSQENSDLYALGMLVIHLLTGVHPQEFQQDRISGEQDWQLHLEGQRLSSSLVVILNRMIRIHAHDRYSSVDDVLIALQSLPVVQKRSQTIQQWFVPSRRSNKRQWLQGAVTLLLMIGSGYLYTHQPQAEALLTRFGLTAPQPIPLTQVHDITVAFAIDRMMISPSNRLLITAGSDHVLRLWTLPLESPLKALFGHTDKILALSMSQDGSLLASGSEDHTIRLWDTASGKLLRVLQGNRAAVTALAMSPDAQTLASGSQDGSIRLWDLKTGIERQTLVLPRSAATSGSAVTAIAYGTKLNRLISASSNYQLQIWNLQTGQLQRTFAGHTAPIVGLQVVDDQTLLSFGNDRVLVWNLQREELRQACAKNSAKSVTASLNHEDLVTVDEKGVVRLWAEQSGQFVHQQSGELGPGELGQNLAVALSPNHRYLASWNANHRLQIWQMNIAEAHLQTEK